MYIHIISPTYCTNRIYSYDYIVETYVDRITVKLTSLYLTLIFTPCQDESYHKNTGCDKGIHADGNISPLHRRIIESEDMDQCIHLKSNLNKSRGQSYIIYY